MKRYRRFRSKSNMEGAESILLPSGHNNIQSPLFWLRGSLKNLCGEECEDRALALEIHTRSKS